jgi:hypothetical protein
MKKILFILCLILLTSCVSTKINVRHNASNHIMFEAVKYNTHYYYIRSKQYYYQSNNCFKQEMQGRK